jgi:hypothetical protein
MSDLMKSSLESNVTGYYNINSGMFSKGTTFFTVETTGTIFGLELGKLYKVERRFNHFKCLY